MLLPELDRFTRENFTATNAFPPGSGTMVSMPALTTGRAVFDAGPAGASELRLTLAGTGGSLLWSGQSNVFSRARELGFNTGLVGWYHPYARVLGSSLNFCFWHPYPPFELGRGHTFGETLLNQWWAVVTPLQQRRLHVRVCERTREEALNLVTNTQIGLLLLHLPGPHKPGCYDAEKGQFTLTSFHTARSYFDNLVLTDRTFGDLRRALEAAGQWDDTWLLLSSDHWWRESAAHDGRIDHRVPFIIKAPGNNQPMTYAPAFNTLITHDLLLAMLRRQITNQPSTITWIDQHRIPPPTAYKTANSDR